MILVVDPEGGVCCLYSEAVDLAALGSLTIRRASQVEPDDQGRWWVDLAPQDGPRLGPFALRSAALDAERQWLECKLTRHEPSADKPHPSTVNRVTSLRP